MNLELLADPREDAFSLLVQIDQVAQVREVGGAVRSQRLQGELLVRVQGTLAASALPVTLERLGLYSLGTPLDTATGEITISGLSGQGLLEPTPDPNEWRLRMGDLQVRLVYASLARITAPPSELDSHASRFETARATLSLRVRVHVFTILEDRLSVVSGTLDVGPNQQAIGALDRLSLSFLTPQGASRAVAVRNVVLPLVVPLQPIRFPSGAGHAANLWDDQLKRANEVWGTCSISFEGRDMFTPQVVPNTTDPVAILQSHPQEGAIEVYFVSANLTAWTYPRGNALAGVIIPESTPPDPLLLAHELGHVLGLCHPSKDDCQKPTGAYDSILDVKQQPFSSDNPQSNCAKARKGGLELLSTNLG